MEPSWTVGRIRHAVESVERWEAPSSLVTLSGGYRIQIESFWRLLSKRSLVRTSGDAAQPFGRNARVDAFSDLSNARRDRSLVTVRVISGAADLTRGFGGYTLQRISSSAGNETWQIEGADGMMAVGQGSGGVAVWS